MRFFMYILLTTCTLGFVTIYIYCILLIYMMMMMYVFHSLSHMCCLFSYFIHMFLVYITCLYFTHDALMDLV